LRVGTLIKGPHLCIWASKDPLEGICRDFVRDQEPYWDASLTGLCKKFRAIAIEKCCCNSYTLGRALKDPHKNIGNLPLKTRHKSPLIILKLIFILYYVSFSMAEDTMK
jgi:hypothetical protein